MRGIIAYPQERQTLIKTEVSNSSKYSLCGLQTLWRYTCTQAFTQKHIKHLLFHGIMVWTLRCPTEISKTEISCEHSLVWGSLSNIYYRCSLTASNKPYRELNSKGELLMTSVYPGDF